MNVDYIIVQAGGKGTRLMPLTRNRPKALVPVDNLPILFHLFQKFPDKRFVIIADYHSDVMRKYLAAFANVKFLVTEEHSAHGTCAGLRKALAKIPDNKSFMLIWSDLVLPSNFKMPDQGGNYIGLSKGFTCRWRYQDGRFEEIASADTGVAGLFVFENKHLLHNVPEGGEFVAWLKQQRITFDKIPLEKTREYGLISILSSEEDKNASCRCRAFNRIEISADGKRLIKTGIDEQGRALAVREKQWYRFVETKGFSNVPRIYSYDPFIMQKIEGGNIFTYHLDGSQRYIILEKLIRCLRKLHSFGEMPTDQFSIYNAYIDKTWKRLDKIRDLVPFADRESIVINGKQCRNVFYHKAEIERRFEDYKCEKFVFLHGDNTFSNLLLDEAMNPILIDPRGYFGYTELFGDPAYDWAKLYYSIVGNYDQFNQKHFQLSIRQEEVELSVQSNGWEDMEESFFTLIGKEADREYIKLIHAIIWLSLTTYAWEDYDSICGAFYNGLYYLDDALSGGL